MRVRTEHWQCLSDYAEKNPELITNRFSGVQGKNKLNALWQNLATKLNSMGFGEKTVEGWKKTLVDWKSKTKSKAAKLKNEINKTGGGPNLEQQLSHQERRLIGIMGAKSFVGDQVAEMGFGRVHVERIESNQTMETVADPEITGHFTVVESEVPEPSSTNVQLDNSYISVNSGNKRQRKTPEERVHKSKRLRPNQVPRISNELLSINAEALETFKRIAGDIHNIAESVKRVASLLEKHFDNH